MTAKPALHGVLVVDKPAELTSAAVVSRARKALRRVAQVAKIGHTGTLDPLATGVLPLVLGEATKLATLLLAEDKAYEAELVLGVETDTLDAHGAVIARADVAVARADLEAALAGLTGAITQVPPMYSAIKVGGRPLHALARLGAEVERAPRAVTIHRLALLAYDPPRARLAIECTKGTYVRVLAADVGRAVGAGAHLSALRRIRSGAFTIDHAIPLAALEADPAAALGRVLTPAAALGLPAIEVLPEHHRAIRDGIVPAAVAAAKPPEAELVQLLTPAGDLLAVAAAGPAGLTLQRVFTYGLTGDSRSRKVPASKHE